MHPTLIYKLDTSKSRSYKISISNINSTWQPMLLNLNQITSPIANVNTYDLPCLRPTEHVMLILRKVSWDSVFFYSSSNILHNLRFLPLPVSTAVLMHSSPVTLSLPLTTKGGALWSCHGYENNWIQVLTSWCQYLLLPRWSSRYTYIIRFLNFELSLICNTDMHIHHLQRPLGLWENLRNTFSRLQSLFVSNMNFIIWTTPHPQVQKMDLV